MFVRWQNRLSTCYTIASGVRQGGTYILLQFSSVSVFICMSGLQQWLLWILVVLLIVDAQALIFYHVVMTFFCWFRFWRTCSVVDESCQSY